MASAITKCLQRCLINPSSALKLQLSTSTSLTLGQQQSRLISTCLSRHNSLPQNLQQNRNILCSSRKFADSTWPSVSCGCSGYHSEGDKRFSEMLKGEIAEEKDQMMTVKDVPGWRKTIDGAECLLTKSLQGDTVEVSFNVNASVPPIDLDNPDAENQDICAEPDFMVTVTKTSSAQTLAFDCYFPEPAAPEEGEPDNIFSIRSVTVYQDEMTDSTYSMETEHMDENLYGNLLTFLQERGVDNQFADDLIELATSVENQQYVKSLEALHDFVSCH